MNSILHIDTSGENAMVALSVNAKLIDHAEHPHPRSHVSAINGMIEKLFLKNKHTFDQLAAVCLLSGPGSYTGLRIGMATAKAICYITEKPLITNNSLELLTGALRQYSSSNPYDRYGALIPAREGEYFFALYDDEAREIYHPSHLHTSALIELLSTQSRILLTGVYDEEIEKQLPPDSSFIPGKKIDITYWCRVAFLHFQQKKFTPVAEAEPLYLKKTYTTTPKRKL